MEVRFSLVRNEKCRLKQQGLSFTKGSKGKFYCEITVGQEKSSVLLFGVLRQQSLIKVSLCINMFLRCFFFFFFKSHFYLLVCSCYESQAAPSLQRLNVSEEKIPVFSQWKVQVLSRESEECKRKKSPKKTSFLHKIQ